MSDYVDDLTVVFWFLGTYPGSEKESLGKLLECEKSEAVKKPPVRVVVSYPQSEEWDGTTGNRHCKLKSR